VARETVAIYDRARRPAVGIAAAPDIEDVEEVDDEAGQSAA